MKRTGRVHDQGHLIDESVHWHELAGELAHGPRKTTRDPGAVTCGVCKDAIAPLFKEGDAVRAFSIEPLEPKPEPRDVLDFGRVGVADVGKAYEAAGFTLTPAASSGIAVRSRRGGDSAAKSSSRGKPRR